MFFESLSTLDPELQKEVISALGKAGAACAISFAALGSALGTGIAAITAAVEEVKGGTEAKTTAPAPQTQTFQCGDCQAQFSPPAGWVGQPLKCPKCSREYAKEELVG